ncbi:membrane-bound lytic murein transglycosylase MltF [Marinicauda salina]|uniref:Membrane-bound lytic murein transglycosylase F n=1 Tax=Marinicauda salina TaxID=2135793 RepID=A0A2U2BV77_9PROT|nr:membrane-bound lytic murein transglycosylase MltF [Marinicauda salina]PWE17897.1 membrane-bound lytic murein transglycosylase MltF [Marinicauda salina]
MIFARKVWIAAAGALLAACGGENEIAGSLEAIRERGELVVLTAPSPTTWSMVEGEPVGYEVDLVEAMAADLGVDVRYEVRADLAGVLEAIRNGEAHIAAAGITDTAERRETLDFSPAYKAVRQQLACRRGGPAPRSVDEMPEVEIAVVARSSYVETLEFLSEDRPALAWEVRDAPSAMPLLAAVQDERLDCTVADSNLVAFARLQYPELITPLNLTGEQTLAWALAPGVDGLDAWLDDWFADAHESGLLEELDQRWYGHVREFDYVDAARFIRRLEERLPPLRPHFVAAADGERFEWPLLAAQAYQESHWNPAAESPTGVRGVMMLTLPTANRVGVSDRTDPRQSIRGGADYLAELYDRLPEAVTGEDRLYMALAAYNIGMGHLYDARALAERLGRDKNEWDDMREVLPLLTQEEHYSTTRYGYARGHEPVRYVRRIRRYQALLEANLEPPPSPQPNSSAIEPR